MKAIVLLALPALGCFDFGAPLTDLGPVSAEVYVDVGVPARPFSGEEEARSLYVDLKGTATDCPMLHEIDATLDGTRPSYVELGGISEGTNHGNYESYCVEPAFYFDYLPPASPRSTIRIADDSAALSMEVDQLLVNPPISVNMPLRPGMPATAIVNDPRQLASAQIWWRGEFDDPTPVDWFAEGDVSTPGQITFTVPTVARGTGTLGIVVTITETPAACAGFTSCTVTVRGGAKFDRTTN